MSFLKKIFKKDDDIPEMHIQKNEPKPYYSKEHNCWLIPGKEKEMLETIAQQKKDPPKKFTSSSQPQPGLLVNKKQKPAVNRYAMILPTESIDDIKEINTGENETTNQSHQVKPGFTGGIIQEHLIQTEANKETHQ